MPHQHRGPSACEPVSKGHRLRATLRDRGLFRPAHSGEWHRASGTNTTQTVIQAHYWTTGTEADSNEIRSSRNVQVVLKLSFLMINFAKLEKRPFNSCHYRKRSKFDGS